VPQLNFDRVNHQSQVIPSRRWLTACSAASVRFQVGPDPPKAISMPIAARPGISVERKICSILAHGAFCFEFRNFAREPRFQEARAARVGASGEGFGDASSGAAIPLQKGLPPPVAEVGLSGLTKLLISRENELGLRGSTRGGPSEGRAGNQRDQCKSSDKCLHQISPCLCATRS